MNEDWMDFKWGTLKGYSLTHNPLTHRILVEYYEEGTSCSVMCQVDTAKQKDILCRAIDSFTGRIYHDWSGNEMTKEEAKKYVMEYDS